MGDNSPRDRAIAAEISLIGSGNKAVDFMPTEWTDEKHKSYLNSIEASFVKQLYSSGRGSNDFLGLSSKAKIHTNSSASDSKNQSFSQFKIQRRRCWEILQFERATGQAENDSESLILCHSPWTQHFRTHSTDNEPLLTLAHQKDNCKVLSFCSQKVHKVSIGSITEGSDQNFVDINDDRGEKLNRRNGKKRARSVISPIKDQVVPFVTPCSDEKAASEIENNEECSRMNVENAGNSF